MAPFTPMSTPGLFIAFEGGEGAGKSTQAARLEERLRTDGYNTLLVREPGSTELGNYLREYLVSDRPATTMAELLLFEASRAELIAELIEPHLANGYVVIADRFAGSTVAYQGYGRRIDLKRIHCLNDYATRGRYPDQTILLDIHPARGLSRVGDRHLQMLLPFDDPLDRFEDEDLAFHDRVRQGFHAELANHQDSWVVIDGDQEIEAVGEAVWEAVKRILPGNLMVSRPPPHTA